MTAALQEQVKVERKWGDGVGRRLDAHVIEDISYSASPNFIICSCGLLMEGDTVADLTARWRGHGGKVMRWDDIVDRANPIGTVTAPEDLWKVWAPIAAQSLRCTCVTPKHPSEGCPNFIEKDRERQPS